MIRFFRLSLLIFVFWSLPAALVAEPAPPEVSLDGMELVETFAHGELYADAGVDWSVYTELQLEPATVAFRRNWQRDQNIVDPFRVRNSDVEKIKQDLAALFDEVFIKELSSNGGYTLTEASGDHVMRIEPHIVDLDVHAPVTSRTSFNRSYTERAGRMTLKLNIYDSVTGDLIASATDRQEAMRRGYAQLSNSVTNKADAQLMLQKWATALRERLDQARSH